ncbi:hypothetical protein Trydic_g8834 [Trypoxylus dichotomus]
MSSPKPRPNVVVKLSSRPLSDNEGLVLAKGLNFAVSPKNIPTEGIIDEVESSIGALPSVVDDQVRFESAKEQCNSFLRCSRNTLGHSVYGKPTHTDQYLHVGSHHHPAQNQVLEIPWTDITYPRDGNPPSINQLFTRNVPDLLYKLCILRFSFLTWFELS